MATLGTYEDVQEMEENDGVTSGKLIKDGCQQVNELSDNYYTIVDYYNRRLLFNRLFSQEQVYLCLHCKHRDYCEQSFIPDTWNLEPDDCLEMFQNISNH